MSERLSRRALIGSGALAIGVLMAGGGAASPTAAEQISKADKIKQTDAHYQGYPKGPQRCQICLQFTRPTNARSCKAHHPSGLVPVLCGQRERALIRRPEARSVSAARPAWRCRRRVALALAKAHARRERSDPRISLAAGGDEVVTQAVE